MPHHLEKDIRMVKPGKNKHSWTKGKSGNPQGRPRKLFSQLKTEAERDGVELASNEDIELCLRYLLSVTMTEVVEIAGKPALENGHPFLMRIAANNLLGKNGLMALRELLDRTTGRPTQKIDMPTTGEVFSPNISINVIGATLPDSEDDL